MLRKVLLTCFVLLIAMPCALTAQEPLPYSQLDPRQYDPAVDPNIDMFIGHWKHSMPRNIHGSLVVRDILTRCTGDPLHPTAKGAVLTELKSVSLAVLEPHARTTPSKLDNEQELYYIVSGFGSVTSGGKTEDLSEGNGIVMPPGVEFTLENTGNEPLTMYLVVEPIPEGFKPITGMRVTYEFDRPQGINVHWANIDRPVLGRGTAVIGGFTAVKIDPMTMAQPHSHGAGVEEVWIAIKGDLKLHMGKQLRELPVGSAYKIPADGITAHANINFTDTQAKLIHMMKNIPHEVHPYSMLNPKLLDPAVDPHIDMFMGNWRDSMPRNIHGSLVVRDILTGLEGDPLRPVTKSACLTDLKSVSFATLEPHASTMPTTLTGEQEIFYVVSGEGTISTAAGSTSELRDGIGILMPPGVEYVMKNTGKEMLTMYRVVEPIPAGFTPKKDMVVADEYVGAQSMSVHWSNIDKHLFGKDDGLATLLGIAPILLDSMTLAQPHSHAEGIEEVWVAVKGDIRVLLGKQLRNLPVGSAYKIPANGMTAHANINASDKPIKLIWMMKVPAKR